jgi:hypothetical protein
MYVLPFHFELLYFNVCISIISAYSKVGCKKAGTVRIKLTPFYNFSIV